MRNVSSRIARSVALVGVVASSLFATSAAVAGNAGTCGVATYCGGPVISSVQIVPIFWTGGVRAETQSWAPDYFNALANSAFVDMLSEYSTAGKTGEVCSPSALVGSGTSQPTSTNQTITRGTTLPAVTITPIKSKGTYLVDNLTQTPPQTPIQDELVAQLEAGKLPAPTFDPQGYPNTLYVMMFPPNYEVGQGGAGCPTQGAYHNATNTYEPPVSCVGQSVPYVVVPDCGDSIDSISFRASHEVAESITDPAITLAWWLGPNSSCQDASNCPTCGEVGDVCGWGQVYSQPVPGTSIVATPVWSQTQRGCTVANPGVGPQVASAKGYPSCDPHADADAGAGAVDAGVVVDAGAASSGGHNYGASGPDAGSARTPEATDAGLRESTDSLPDAGASCAMTSPTHPASLASLEALGALALLGGVRRARRRASCSRGA